MQTEKVNMESLVSPEYNPRTITSEEMEKLKNSINEFGYVDPIIVNRVNNHIVGGNQRFLALKELGYDEVDVIFIVEEDINREKALNIALNKISGDWDEEKLEHIFQDLEFNGFDLTFTGFDNVELQDFNIERERANGATPVIEDDYTDDDIIVTVQYGDIYILGNHRLMCGDSTKNEDINLLIDGNKIHMILTDPPYGMGLDTDYSVMKSNLKFVKEKNTDVSGKKYKQGLVDSFDEQFIKNILELDVNETFLWGADYYTENIPDLKEGSWIVWDKRLTEGADKMFGSCFELCWSKNKHKRDIARIKWAGIFGSEQEFDHKRHHPTQKPIKLNVWFLERYSKENDNVLDVFGGSGSTLIACEQLNRQCYMMELDPYYCQVIINRWEEFTGQKAIKLN